MRDEIDCFRKKQDCLILALWQEFTVKHNRQQEERITSDQTTLLCNSIRQNCTLESDGLGAPGCIHLPIVEGLDGQRSCPRALSWSRANVTISNPRPTPGHTQPPVSAASSLRLSAQLCKLVTASSGCQHLVAESSLSACRPMCPRTESRVSRSRHRTQGKS
jgi:hypothetical protein